MGVDTACQNQWNALALNAEFVRFLSPLWAEKLQTPDFFEENPVPTSLGVSVARSSEIDLDGDGFAEWLLAERSSRFLAG